MYQNLFLAKRISQVFYKKIGPISSDVRVLLSIPAQILMDLAFLFDNSANTTKADFMNAKRLVASIVHKMHVSDVDVRTALSYAAGGQLKSNLVFKIPQSMHQFSYR